MLVLLTKENVMSGINKKLEKLYNSYYDKAKQAYKEQKPKIEQQGAEMSSPLLIKIDEKAYKKADKKIMIFGQETYGWHGEFGGKDIKFLQEYQEHLKRLTGNKKDFSDEQQLYVNFLMNDYFMLLSECKEYFDNSVVVDNTYIRSKKRLKKKQKRRSFWRGVKFFEDGLEGSYVVWNNISKVGRKKGTGVNPKIKKFEREYFKDIIDKEICILKPDIIIFFGWGRYKDVKYKFDIDSKIEHKTDNGFKFAEINFKNLKSKAIRLYHPAYRGKNFEQTKTEALKILNTTK